MDEVYEEIKEAGNYVVDGVEKTLTDAANSSRMWWPRPRRWRGRWTPRTAPPPPPDEFERDDLGLSRDDVLKAPAAAEGRQALGLQEKCYARGRVCPVLPSRSTWPWRSLQLRRGAAAFSPAAPSPERAARPRGLNSGRAELCGNQNFTARSC